MNNLKMAKLFLLSAVQYFINHKEPTKFEKKLFIDSILKALKIEKFQVKFNPESLEKGILL
jgi:hypothetical protein